MSSTYNRYGTDSRAPYMPNRYTSSRSGTFRSNNTSSQSTYSAGGTLLEKSRGSFFAQTPALPSKKTIHGTGFTSRNYSRDYDLDSSRYSSSSSRIGRAERKSNDIIRPPIRSRNTSLTRDSGRRGELMRRQSLSRVTESRDYPELSTRISDSNADSYNNGYAYTGRQQSPAQLSRRPVPQFTEIKSEYNKPQRRNGTRNARSPSSSNRGTSLLNGHTSPTTIEAKRTIHKTQPNRISVDEPGIDSKPYSPSFAQNRTSNNNKDYDGTSGSSRSSSGSKREESYLNGDSGVLPSSIGHPLFASNAGLVGLKNIGNTCFMNSILQCLSNTKLLRDYIIEKKYQQDINKTSSPMKGNLVEAFHDIIRQLWHPSSSGSPVPTTGFKSQIQKFSKRFSGYEQQDSQEFLRFLIEGLHEDVNKVKEKPKNSIPNFDSLCDENKAKKTWDFYLSKDKSYIVDLFMGQLKSSLQCAECKHISTTFDPFWDLSLPLPKNGYREADLQSCLDIFTREEILEGDERPTCDKCKARRRMTKKFTIYKFPRILVIHLKRFSEGQRFRQKLSSRVDFPHRLEIRSPVSVSSVHFNLYAVSNHSGSCYGGHYTAYCKNPETKQWHSFNDSLVSSMSQSSVQSKEAYVLFYEMSSTSCSKSHL